MRRSFLKKLVFGDVILLLALALTASMLHATTLSPNIAVTHGPTMPPAPWEYLQVAHGPTMPPAPWEYLQVAHGPTMPPAPWEYLRASA